MALGLGSLGMLIFAAGILGRLQLGMTTATAVLALAAIMELKNVSLGPANRLWSTTMDASPRQNSWKTGLAVVFGMVFIHTAISASAPPAGWDALAYHLALPRLYLDTDAVIEIPWLLHSHWPHLMEVLYCLPLALGLESGGSLVHAAMCAALVLTVFRLGREHGSPGSGWIAAALLACQPVLLDIAAEPHSDGALTLFHLLACALLWSWSQKNDTGALKAAGLCAGMAAACKLQGLALGATLALWILWSPRRRPGFWKFLFWAALPAAPWLIRTWITAGNPVWPFFSRFLGGNWEPRHIELALARVCSWRFPRDIALLWNYDPQFLLLPSAGLALLALGKSGLPPFFRFLFLPALPMLILSLPYHEAWRYLLPLTPALALACGWWCLQACSSPGFKRWAACAATVFGLLPVTGLSHGNELFAVLAARSSMFPGTDSREIYKIRRLPFYLFYKKAERVLSNSDKVLLFREVRGYHLRASYQWGDPVIQSQIIYSSLAGPDELLARLRGLGLTHVLVNTGNGIYGLDEDYYNTRILVMMETMLHRRARVLLREGALSLYALNGEPPR